jgi:hypothetical protein
LAREFIAVDLAAERGLFDNDSRRIDGKAPRYRYPWSIDTRFCSIREHAVPAGLWSSYRVGGSQLWHAGVMKTFDLFRKATGGS